MNHRRHRRWSTRLAIFSTACLISNSAAADVIVEDPDPDPAFSLSEALELFYGSDLGIIALLIGVVVLFAVVFVRKEDVGSNSDDPGDQDESNAEGREIGDRRDQ